MPVRTNVTKKDYSFPIRRPDGSVSVVSVMAESRSAARLLLKPREEAGEFSVLKDGDGK